MWVLGPRQLPKITGAKSALGELDLWIDRAVAARTVREVFVRPR